MRIKLAYGKQGLMLDLPDDWNVTVIEPRYVPGLPDPAGAMRAALQKPIGARPLADIVRPGDQVGIVFSDITRATPHGLILPAVLAELSHMPKEQITLCCALGTHRPNTADELRSMFTMAGTPEIADELLSSYRLVQNDSFDPETQVAYRCDLARARDLAEPRDRRLRREDPDRLYRAALLCRLLRRRQGADAGDGGAAHGARQP